MKYIKKLFFILIFIVVSSVQATLPPSLDPPLDNLTIYSRAAIAIGASSTVNGNMQANAATTVGLSSIVGGSIVAGAAVTLEASVKVSSYIEARDAATIGANATIGGYLTVGDAATLGANTIDGNIMVGGDLTAGAAILVGVKAVIDGNLMSVAAVNLAADVIIHGNATAGAALSIGASVIVDGHVQAGSGAVTLGANTAVAGDATAGASVTLASGASVGGTITQGSVEIFTNPPKDPIDDQNPQLVLVQAALAAMAAPAENELLTSMTISTTLTKGIYHATSLSTTGGVTITFDGENEDGHWLINSDTFISFGANTVMLLKDVTPNSTITWNTGGYTSAGASVNLLGTIFAGTYIITGASATLNGIGGTCGGLFTTTGAVILGASNIIGSLGCTPQPLAIIHHYEVVHDGQGLTCDTESVMVKACTDVGCLMLSTEPVMLEFLADGVLVSTETFTGSTVINFNNTDVETLTFSVANASIIADSPLVCDDGSGNSCDMAFTDAGFRFLYGAGNSTTLPNQISGTLFSDTLKIQAVKDTNGVCTGLFTSNNNVDLSQENVNPGGTGGLNFSINNNSAAQNIAKHSSFTNTTLNFGADSIATISAPIYHDAGQIRLHANYDVGGVILSGSSNTFWVSPAELVVSATLGATVLNGASASAAPTHKAGDNFTLSVTALNSLGVITPNYSPGQIQFKLTRTGPTLLGSVDGNLSYAASSILTTSTSPVFQSVTLTNFSSGVSTYNTALYSEVGLINLEVQDINYGNVGIAILPTATNIGRFIPDHFKQTVAEGGFFKATCGINVDFAAYSGQKNESNNTLGAISYLTNPILAITAYNQQGNITQNYYEDSQGSANDYMKLSSASVTITAPTLDQVATGVDTNKLSLTANMNTGTLSQNDLTALPSVVALPKGTLHYQLSDNDSFFYNRSANAVVTPFTSDIDFSTATVIDTDSVNVTTTVAASPTGVEIRFGRLILKNSFGPETSNLPQPMQLEHFDGTAFTVTSDNNCVSYDASNMILTNISLDPSLSNVLGGTGSFVLGKTREIQLESPGVGNQGEIGVSYDTYNWLKYDWDNDGAYDDNPSVVTTFGLYRGNDRIIYWREISN
jgi:predicted acyltransferase (DUF342 family)